MYTLKNIKTYPRLSTDSNAFSGILYKNDKKIADCKDNGFGGSIDIDFINSKESKDFYDFIKTLPPTEYQGTKLEMCSDLFVGEFVSKHLQQKEHERQIKHFAKKGLNTVLYGEPKNNKLPFYVGCNNKEELKEIQSKYPDFNITVLHTKEVSAEELLQVNHKRNITAMLKKKNVQVVVYVEEANNSGYIGLSHISQLSQVNKKYPTAKVSVIHQ